MDERIIEKEDAVFWMDNHGNWHNEFGKIAKTSIIKHFNKSIRFDDKGFYVTQSLGEIVEKIYFSFVETALFGIDLNLKKEPPTLRLNNHQVIPFDPNQLRHKGDSLFTWYESRLVKLKERCLIKLSKWLSYDEVSGEQFISMNGKKIQITGLETLPGNDSHPSVNV